VLPADHRLTDPGSFRRATKLGRRSGSRLLVTHLLLAEDAEQRPAQVGFVVSRAVGSAVRRNRVKRRLRHAMRDLVALLPPAAVLVVRAQPAAASSSSAELAADLDRCLRRSLAHAPSARVAR